MGTERPNYMPNEKAFEPVEICSSIDADLDPEKIILQVGRRFCEPSEKLYKNASDLKDDPLKAIESVDWTGSPLTEIKDPIDGLVVAAAKLHTAQNELPLNPKQKEHFEGFRQNIEGAVGFLGALESTIKSKVIRSVATGTTVVTMALSAAGCGNVLARPVDEITPNTSPATEVFTPTGSLTEVPTISPTASIFSTETQTPVDVWGAAYPKSAENLIKTPSISGAEARKIIIEKGAGGDLDLLEKWYKSEGIVGSGMSNFVVPVVYNEGGHFNWDLMVKKNNGNFVKFTLTSGPESGELVRGMGMIRYLKDRPSFEVSELQDPAGMGNVNQQVIWDRSGWSVIGAFQGNTLVAWFNADAPNGGEWIKLQEIVPTVEPTQTPEPTQENFSYSSSINPDRLAAVQAGFVPRFDEYSIDRTDKLNYPLVGAVGYPVAYNLEKNENGAQLSVLFATGGGLVKADVDVVNFAQEAWPQTMYEIDRIDGDEAKMISESIDNLINQINEGEKFRNSNSYIILITINTKADAQACKANHRGLNNVEQICKYDPLNSQMTSVQMLDKLESFVVSNKGKTLENSLDFEGYPTLSSEGNMYVRFQLQSP